MLWQKSSKLLKKKKPDKNDAVTIVAATLSPVTQNLLFFIKEKRKSFVKGHIPNFHLIIFFWIGNGAECCHTEKKCWTWLRFRLFFEHVYIPLLYTIIWTLSRMILLGGPEYERITISDRNLPISLRRVTGLFFILLNIEYCKYLAWYLTLQNV